MQFTTKSVIDLKLMCCKVRLTKLILKNVKHFLLIDVHLKSYSKQLISTICPINRVNKAQLS